MGLQSVLDRATWVAKHPLSATAQTVGVIKGAAAAASDLIHRTADDRRSEQAEPSAAPPVPPQTARVEPVPAAEQRAPEPPHESFATEPSAVTRASAHGGHADDERLDDWYGAYDEDEVPEGVVASLELGDRGELVDQAAIKAELSRSEIARRGAQRDPE